MIVKYDVMKFTKFFIWLYIFNLIGLVSIGNLGHS